ncbi:MAG: chorismate mutase [Candidatus Limnocylindrales bacterium]|jgi:chorismate mutase/prephenate dehydratase
MGSGSKGPKESVESRELETLRSRIDELDVRIVRLLNRRARLGLQAGHVKTLNGRPVADAEREREVLVRVAMANDGPLPQEVMLALYRQLIETIKRLEELKSSEQDGGSHG